MSQERGPEGGEERGRARGVEVEEPTLAELAVDRRFEGIRRAAARVASGADVVGRETELALARPLACLLVAASGDARVRGRFAWVEAQRFASELEVLPDSALVAVARAEGLGIEGDGRWRVAVPEYVAFAARRRDPSLRLVRQRVECGWVVVGRRELVDLARCAREARVLREVDIVLPRGVATMFAPLVAELVQRLTPPPPLDGGAPPCVRALEAAIASGAGVSHQGRFALATFLAGRGFARDAIVEAFARSPNYRADATAYQVDHVMGAAGGRGGGTRYTMPSCASMRTNGLCVPDAVCCSVRRDGSPRVRHPLQYAAAGKREAGP